jgi:diguanylate cyclase (GGDEF)-like protein/PAS domain S-box-containing protein
LKDCFDTYSSAFDARREFRMEYRLRRYDGEYRWIADHGVPRFDGTGVFLGYIGNCVDITDSKEMEKELRLSEARYKRITEGLTDYQYTVRIENGRAVETTQSSDCVTVTGYTAEEFAADPYLWIQMVVPEDRERVREHVRQVLMGKDVPPIEHHIIRKDGKIRWVSDTIILFKDASGKLLSYDGVIKDITERKKTEEQIRNMAFYDSLTQLPNRRMLNDRLGQAMAASKRSGLYGALMFLDLDNFKPLNDTYGHDVGDLLLVEVARRLTGCVREMDTVARFGGDEFVVMFTELHTDKAESVIQAGVVAEKIRATLAEPYLLVQKQEGKAEVTIEHHCTSSIGVVLFIDHEASPGDIIKWADMAMYKAKDGGRNRYYFYEPKNHS